MNLFGEILNIILPRQCAVCSTNINGSKRDFLCDCCFEAIEIIKDPFCKSCGRPFVSKETLRHSPGHLCAACREKKLYFHSARAIGAYSGILKKLIHIYKFKKKRALGEPLSEIMIDHLDKRFERIDFDMLLPVPLHKKRLREREFDQSLLLALHMGRRLKIPVLADFLIRCRYTRPQLELKVKERARNVKNAFKINGVNRIEGKNILLVDDVFTTGATVNECSRVLKKQKPNRIDVLVLSRTC